MRDDDDDKLRIALEALLEIQGLADTDRDLYHYYSKRIASAALRAIQREHYLGERSPVVHQMLAGVKL
jgi:hypothetical protein